MSHLAFIMRDVDADQGFFLSLYPCPSCSSIMEIVVNIFGAALCGIITSTWILGLISVLSFQYFLTFPQDRLWTKLLVAWTWALQVFSVIIMSRMIYFYLITSFGSTDTLRRATWEWSLIIGISAVSPFSVQCYYAWRIYMLSKSRVLFFTILLFAFLQLGFGLATMSEAFKLVYFQNFIPFTWGCVTWLASSATCDLIITVVQVVYLHKHRTGISGTNRVINALILYILSTGLLTSIIAILELATFASLGFNFVHDFLSFPMGGVYTVSLLANLHARRSIRDMDSDISSKMDLNLSSAEPMNIEFRRIREINALPSSATSTRTRLDA